METSSLVGFGLTVGFLVTFLVVSWAQLGRARRVGAGEIGVGGRPAGDHDPDGGPDDDPDGVPDEGFGSPDQSS